MSHPIVTHNQKEVYDNKWIRIWEDDIIFPDGEHGIYGYMERKTGGSMIIPMTENGEIYILREWRYPIREWSWSFPHGDRDGDESFLDAAKRELFEETGIRGGEWTELGTLHIDPGYNTQITPVFLVKQFTVEERPVDPKEINEVHVLPLEKIDQMIADSTIDNGWALAGFAKLKVYLGQRQS